MTRPRTQHTAAAVDRIGPDRSRRHHRGTPGDPIHATKSTPTSPSDFKARIARALSTATSTAALLPLESAGCDSRCAIPAFHDRTTGAWRHLTDLKHCQRPAIPTEEPEGRRPPTNQRRSPLRSAGGEPPSTTPPATTTDGFDWNATISLASNQAEIATELVNQARPAGTPTDQAGDRLDVADYLISTGRCADGIDHARAAWINLPHDQPPSSDRERFARLLTGIRAAYLLGGCHQHDDAVSTMFDALERYTGIDPDDPDGLDPAVREQRWQSALLTYGERREHHRGVHRHCPCDDEHNGETVVAPGEHRDQILALINARRPHRETRT